MKNLTAKRFPTHFQVRRWRALLMMLAIHGCLLLIYSFIMYYDSMIHQIIGSSKSVEGIVMKFPVSIILFMGVASIDVLIWMALNAVSRILAQCWSAGIAMYLLLAIYAAPFGGVFSPFRYAGYL